MDSPNDLQTLASDLETALTGLVKLIKALSFYPADHPSLSTASEDASNDFQALLERHDTRPYHVTKVGFSLDATPLAHNNKSLANLALMLVERRIRHLLFLPELQNHELLMFAEELSKPAAELLAAGGMEKRLAARQITSIWVNETNLEAIQANQHTTEEREFSATAKDAVEELSSAAEAARPQQQNDTDQIRDLLERLKEPLNDQNYRDLLDQLQQLVPPFFSQTGIAGYLAVFILLENHRKDTTRSSEQRQVANTLIDQLLTETTRKTLVDAVADQKLKASQQRALLRLLVGLGSKIAPQLLKRLYAERDAIIRRLYCDVLASMGEAIFELLRTGLQSTTWHEVRNAVTVLGRTRLESALPLLTQAIDHPEMRVRRSVIHALGSIGGNAVIPLLLRLGKDTDKDLHHPAIMALGALKNPQAIPPLVEILQKNDLSGKQNELKIEAIQALAATKSPQAIIPLLKLARRSNLLNRRHIESLRAEAILALGQVGNEQLIPVLNRLPRQEKESISRALKQAVAQLRKQPDVA